MTALRSPTGLIFPFVNQCFPIQVAIHFEYTAPVSNTSIYDYVIPSWLSIPIQFIFNLYPICMYVCIYIYMYMCYKNIFLFMLHLCPISIPISSIVEYISSTHPWPFHSSALATASRFFSAKRKWLMATSMAPVERMALEVPVCCSMNGWVFKKNQ